MHFINFSYKWIGGMGSRKGPDLLNQQNNKYDFQKEKKKK